MLAAALALLIDRQIARNPEDPSAYMIHLSAVEQGVVQPQEGFLGDLFCHRMPASDSPQVSINGLM